MGKSYDWLADNFCITDNTTINNVKKVIIPEIEKSISEWQSLLEELCQYEDIGDILNDLRLYITQDQDLIRRFKERLSLVE